MDLERIIDEFSRKSKLALSKIITFVERNPEKSFEVFTRLHQKTGRSLMDENIHIIGITGPAGVGKSTLIDKLIKELEDVAVLLCDPSSPHKGGAILGDRIRIQGNGAFIRSVGTRGEGGGISLNTEDIINLYFLFGFKNIILETAGIGQSEIEVYYSVDTVVLLLSPESGDEIQFMKSGILEVADIVALNKSDRPLADKVFNEIKLSLELYEKDWTPRVLKIIAKDGIGIDELIKYIKEHKKYLDDNGITKTKREVRIKREFERITLRKLKEKIFSRKEFKENLERVLSGEIDPYSASEELIKKI